MTDQSGLQALFESALQAYENDTGISLAGHPLAAKLQNCTSTQDITALLRGQAQAFRYSQASYRIMNSIKTTVSILTQISDAASLTFSPAKAILTGLGILLDVCAVLQFICRYPCDIQMNQVAKGATSSGDALVDLLESIEQFIKRLDIYTRIPFTPIMVEMVVKIMAEILSTLALMTKKFKQARPSACVLGDMIPYSARRSQI
jgi:hypothetical protein